MATQPKVIDFELTPELQEFQNGIRQFATEEVAPQAKALDAEQRFPRELVQRAGELGLLKMTIPTVLFIFPTMFLLVIGPVALRAMEVLK